MTIRQKGDRVLVDVHVVPRASKTALAGLHDGRIKVSLAAPPVDGAANDALIAFFARVLGCAKRDVELLRGETSRKKTLAIRGVVLAKVLALLE